MALRSATALPTLPGTYSGISERLLKLKHVIQEVALLGKPRSSYYNGSGQVPLETIRKIAATLPCGDCSWVYYGTAYGPAAMRAAKLNTIREAFLKVPGARWIPRNSLPQDHYFFTRERISSGTPEFEELRWLNWMPNGAHVFFSPVSAPRGDNAWKLFQIAKQKHEEFNLDSFPAICIGLREMYIIINMVYDKGDSISKANAYACMRAMIREAAAEGFGEYRTHLLLQDQVAATYSWNNNALMKFHEQLKDSLDPKGILAPGKNGIWPRKYRGKGWELGANDLDRSEGESVQHNTRLAKEGAKI